MIHYLPIEQAPAIGQGLFYIYCIWVHGYKEGVGNHQKQGIGKQLLAAAEADARQLGASGMAAWGVMIPVFMRSQWFKKQGYRRADRDGLLELVWKPFTAAAVAPRLLRSQRQPEPIKGQVSVTCLRNGWCPAQNLACERIKRAVADFPPEQISYCEIDTENRAALLDWGRADAIYIDNQLVPTGPPPTYASLKQRLAKKIKRLRR